jgi:hypothetical protein
MCANNPPSRSHRFWSQLMSRNFAVTALAVLLGSTLACTSKSSTPLTPTTPGTGGTSGPASDGSTMKVTAPVPLSPVNDTKPELATLVIGGSTGTYVGPVAVSYRFQVFNSGNALVEDVLVKTTSHTVDTDLNENSRYTWRSRAETPEGDFGPWSTTASFIAPSTAFLNREIRDPLTNGKTVGIQHGGTFLPGVGWQSLSHSDGIDYDLTETCVDNCTLEFDITNIGAQEGLNVERDLKFISMGRSGDFHDFFSFRNSPWKMQLIQRADHKTGMEIIWRNGDSDEGDPGDHRIKLTSTPIEWESENVYHFSVEWAVTGFRVSVNGIQVMREGWNHPYAPSSHKISLGCHPRGESFLGAIYRNIRLTRA